MGGSSLWAKSQPRQIEYLNLGRRKVFLKEGKVVKIILDASKIPLNQRKIVIREVEKRITLDKAKIDLIMKRKKVDYKLRNGFMAGMR